MTTTNLNIRTDKEVKNKAEEIFKELGLNMTTAINMYLRATIRENGIPFDIKLDEPNETTIAAIEKARKGEDMYGPFDSVDEMMKALNA